MDFFDLKEVLVQKNVINISGYYKKTQEIFEFLLKEHSNCWQRRSINNEEYPDEEVCKKCKGIGIYREGIGQCMFNNDDCFIQFFDGELFTEQFESKIDEICNLVDIELSPV